MRVLVDCDGVLCDFIGMLVEICHDVGDYSVSRETFTRWEYKDCLSPETYEKVQLAITIGSAYCTMRELPGWYRFFPGGDIYENHEVVYVTSANKYHAWLAGRFHWLTIRGAKPEQIIFCSPAEKAEIRGDILIEDNKDILESWINFSCVDVGYQRYYLVDAPYNQGHGIFTRIKSLEELSLPQK